VGNNLMEKNEKDKFLGVLLCINTPIKQNYSVMYVLVPIRDYTLYLTTCYMFFKFLNANKSTKLQKIEICLKHHSLYLKKQFD